jgi:hypothetical protein
MEYAAFTVLRDRVWMTCSCGAALVRVVAFG